MARPKENVIIEKEGPEGKYKSKYKINKATGKLKTGRPKVITEEVAKKLEEQFSRNSSIKTACAMAGVPQSVYYAEMQRNPVFKERMEKAQEYIPSLADRVIAKSIRDGDSNTAKRMKERTDDRYKKETKIGIQTETDPEKGTTKTGLVIHFDEV